MKFKCLSLLSLSVPLAFASGAAVADTFYCKGPLADAVPFKVTATAAEGLMVEINGAKPTYFGPVDMNGATYDARREVSENGGTATTHYVIDRTTGEYTFEMHMRFPGMRPFDSKGGGHCEGVDPPAGSPASDPVGGGSASEPMSGSTSSGAGDSEPSPPVAVDQETQGVADDSQKMEDDARRLEEEARVAREKADAAKRDREAKVAREQAEAERLKLQAEEERKRKEAEELAAREKAKAEAKRLADQQRTRDESMLRETFNAQATTCPGGGAGIFYLRSSKPHRLGCNVTFEARCVGTPGGVVNFGQRNYIGSSCLGIGDAIRIGQMACPAEQVQIQMTSASCG